MTDYSTLKQQIVDDIKKGSGSGSRALKQIIQNGSANYQTVAEYSKILGDVVSKCITEEISEGISDEELEAFAKECLSPIYRQMQDTVLGACRNVQKAYNEQAGIALNPAEIEPDKSRIEHIVERFTEAETFDEVKFLTEPNTTRSISRGAVQDSIKGNAKLQSDAGLKVRISRSDGAGCCDWCSSVVGTFDSFESLPDGFWRIHRGCNCVIDYRVGKTKDKISFNTDENKKLVKVTEEIQEGSNIVANLEQKGIQVNIEKAEKLKDIAILNLEHLDELTNEYKNTLVSYSVGALSGTQTELGSAYMFNGKTSVTISPEAFKVKKATDSLGLGSKQVFGTTYHEFAHSLSQSREKTDKDFWKEIRNLKKEYESLRNNSNWFDIRISPYASKDIDEFIAESFTQAKLSEKPSPYALRTLEVINKYFKK